MLRHERKLLTDQQLRDASRDQLEDLVHRINLMLQARGEPGLVWRTSSSEQRAREDHPGRSNPFDPPTM
jgi:hypothetical protein